MRVGEEGGGGGRTKRWGGLKESRNWRKLCGVRHTWSTSHIYNSCDSGDRESGGGGRAPCD